MRRFSVQGWVFNVSFLPPSMNLSSPFLNSHNYRFHRNIYFRRFFCPFSSIFLATCGRVMRINNIIIVTPAKAEVYNPPRVDSFRRKEKSFLPVREGRFLDGSSRFQIKSGMTIYILLSPNMNHTSLAGESRSWTRFRKWKACPMTLIWHGGEGFPWFCLSPLPFSSRHSPSTKKWANLSLLIKNRSLKSILFFPPPKIAI